MCTDIIDHVSHEMRKKLVENIVLLERPFSVLIDESTSLGKKSCLILYIRSCVGESVDPLSFFLDMVDLQDATADGICEALLECLYVHGLTDAILSQFWLGLGTDGASVMLGKRGGLCTKLKEKFPNLISWHCFNHRLELAVHDAVKACTEINHFKIFLEKLYTLYSVSPKNRRALEKCAAQVGAELHKIGRVLDVRWVASSSRTVRAVWTCYPALHTHFVQSAGNYTLDSKERAQYRGMADKLESAVFLKNVAVMLDALEELADLSESLQADSMSMPKAHKLIQRQVNVFQARKMNDGDKLSIASKAIAEGKFNGVILQCCGSQRRDQPINKNQFYQALIDSLEARLIPDTENSFLESMNTLFPSSWSNMIVPEHGESELKVVSTKFLVPFSSALKQAYRDFKESKGADVAPVMQQIISAVATLPVSTAACERGFSKMNIVCTPLRSTLTVAHISSLLFISMVGPPVVQWNPMPYVKTWIAKGRRHSQFVGCAERSITSDATTAVKAMWKVF